MTIDEIKKLFQLPEVAQNFNEIAAQVPPEQRENFYQEVFRQLSQLPSPVPEPVLKAEEPAVAVPQQKRKDTTPVLEPLDLLPQVKKDVIPPFEESARTYAEQQRLQDAWEKAYQALVAKIPNIVQDIYPEALEELRNFSYKNFDLFSSQIYLRREAPTPTQLRDALETAISEGERGGKDVSRLKPYFNVLDKIHKIKELREQQEKRGVKGIVAGLVPKTFADYLRLLPVAGTLTDIEDALEFKKLADKVEKGTATGQELTDFVLQTIVKYEETKLPFWVKTGQTIRDMIPYMAEFALAGATAPFKVAGKGITNIMVRSAGMTLSLPGLLKIGKHTTEYLTPVVRFVVDPSTEELVMQITKGDDFVGAVSKALPRTFLEFGTEQFGELLPTTMGFKKLILGKWLAKNGFLTKTGKVLVQVGELIDKYKEVGGWHTIIGEVFEEEADAFLTSLFGLEKPEEGKYRLIDPQRWASEVVPIAIFGFFTGMPGRVGEIIEAKARIATTSHFLDLVREGRRSVELKTQTEKVTGKVDNIEFSSATITTEDGKTVNIEFPSAVITTEDGKIVNIPLWDIQQIRITDVKTTPLLKEAKKEVMEKIQTILPPKTPPTTEATIKPPPTTETTIKTPPTTEATIKPPPPTTEAKPPEPAPKPSTYERVYNILQKMGIKELTPSQQIELSEEIDKLPQELTDEQITDILYKVTRVPPTPLEQMALELPFEKVETKVEPPPETQPETPPETKPPAEQPVETPVAPPEVTPPLPEKKIKTLEIPPPLQDILGAPPKEVLESVKTQKELMFYPTVTITMTQEKGKPKKVTGRVTGFDAEKKLVLFRDLSNKTRGFDIAFFKQPNVKVTVDWGVKAPQEQLQERPAEYTIKTTEDFRRDIIKTLQEAPQGLTSKELASKLNTSTEMTENLLKSLQNIGSVIFQNGTWTLTAPKEGENIFLPYPQGKTSRITAMPDAPAVQYALVPLNLIRNSFSGNLPPHIQAIIQGRVESPVIAEQRINEIIARFDPQVLLESTGEGMPVATQLSTPELGKIAVALTNLRLEVLKKLPQDKYQQYIDNIGKRLPEFFEGEELEKARTFIDEQTKAGNRVALIRYVPDIAENPQAIRSLADALNRPLTRQQTTAGVISNLANILLQKESAATSLYDIIKLMGAGEAGRFVDAQKLLTKEGETMAQKALIQGILLKALKKPEQVQSIANRIFKEDPPLGLKTVQNILLDNALELWNLYVTETDVERRNPQFNSNVLPLLLAIDYCVDYASAKGNLVYNLYLEAPLYDLKNEVVPRIAEELKKREIKDITVADIVAIMLGAQLIPRIDGLRARLPLDFLESLLEKHQEIAETLQKRNAEEIKRSLIQQYGNATVEQFLASLDEATQQISYADTQVGDLLAKYNTSKLAVAYLTGVQKFLGATFPQLSIFDIFADLPPSIVEDSRRIAIALAIVPKKETTVKNLFEMIKNNIIGGIERGQMGEGLFMLAPRKRRAIPPKTTREEAESPEANFKNTIIKILEEKETAGLIFVTKDNNIEAYPLEIGAPSSVVSLLGLALFIKRASEFKTVYTYHSHPRGVPALPSLENKNTTMIMATSPLGISSQYGGEIIITKDKIKLLQVDPDNKLRIRDIEDLVPQFVSEAEYRRLMEIKDPVICRITYRNYEDSLIISFPPGGLLGALLPFCGEELDIEVLNPEKLTSIDKQMLEFAKKLYAEPPRLEIKIQSSDITPGSFVEIRKKTAEGLVFIASGVVKDVKKVNFGVEITLGRQRIFVPINDICQEFVFKEIPGLASEIKDIQTTLGEISSNSMEALRHIWGGEFYKQLHQGVIVIKLGKGFHKYQLTPDSELATELKRIWDSPHTAIASAIDTGIVKAIANIDNLIARLGGFSAEAALSMTAILRNWLKSKLPPVELWEKIRLQQTKSGTWTLTPEQMAKLGVQTNDPTKAAEELGLDTSSPAKFFKMPFANYPLVQNHFSFYIQKEIITLFDSVLPKREYQEVVDNLEKELVKLGEKPFTPEQKKILTKILKTGDTILLHNTPEGQEILEIFGKHKDKLRGIGEGQASPQLTLFDKPNPKQRDDARRVREIVRYCLSANLLHWKDLDHIVNSLLSVFSPIEVEIIHHYISGEKIPQDLIHTLTQENPNIYAKAPRPELILLENFENMLLKFLANTPQGFSESYYDIRTTLENQAPLKEVNDAMQNMGIDASKLTQELAKQDFFSQFRRLCLKTQEKLKKTGKQITEQVVMPYWYTKLVDDMLRLEQEIPRAFVNKVERALLESGLFSLSFSGQQKVISALMFEDINRIHLTNERPDLLNNVVGLNKQEFAVLQKIRKALTLGMDYYEKAIFRTIYIAELFPQVKTLVEAWMQAKNKKYDPELIYNLYHLLLDPDRAITLQAGDKRLLGYVTPLTIRQAFEKAKKFAQDMRQRAEIKTPVSFDGENYYVQTTDGKRFYFKDPKKANLFVLTNKMPLVYHNCYFPHMWASPVLAGFKRGNTASLSGFDTAIEAKQYIGSIINNEQNDTPIIVRNEEGIFEVYVKGKVTQRFENAEKAREWAEAELGDNTKYIEVIPPFDQTTVGRENITPLFVILNNLPFISQILEDYLSKALKNYPDIKQLTDLGNLRSTIIDEIHKAISPRLAKRAEEVNYIGYDLFLKHPNTGFTKWTNQMHSTILSLMRPAFNVLASLEPDSLRRQIAYDTIASYFSPSPAMLRAQKIGGLMYPLALSKLAFAIITQPSQQINTLCYLVSQFGEKIALPTMAKQGAKTAAFYGNVARAMALYMKMLYKTTTTNPKAAFEKTPISLALFLENEVERFPLFTEMERKILKRALQEGTISGMRLDELGITTSLYFLVNFFQNISEIQNRTCAVLAGVEAAQKSGINDEQEIYQIARLCSYRTQYPYTMLNRPKWTRNALGTLAYLFKSYTYNTAFLMKHMATKRLRAVLYMSFIYWMLGGLASIPILGPVIQTVFQVFKRFFITPTSVKKLNNIIKGNGLENWIWRTALFGTSHHFGIPTSAFAATEIGQIAIWDLYERTSRFLEGVVRRTVAGDKHRLTWDLLRTFPLLPAGIKAIIDFIAYRDLTLPPNPDGTPRINILDIQNLPWHKRAMFELILTQYSAEKLSPHEQILRLIGMNPARTYFAYFVSDIINSASWNMRWTERILKSKYLQLRDRLLQEKDSRKISNIIDRMFDIEKKLVLDYEVDAEELSRTITNWEKRKIAPKGE